VSVLDPPPLPHTNMPVCLREWNPLLLRKWPLNLMWLLVMQQLLQLQDNCLQCFNKGTREQICSIQQKCAYLSWLLTISCCSVFLLLLHIGNASSCLYSTCRNMSAAHSVAEINAAASMDDPSNLSGNEKRDTKSTRLLHNYFFWAFSSQEPEELLWRGKLITSNLGLIFKKLKFITAYTDLHFQVKIAKTFYAEIKISEAF